MYKIRLYMPTKVNIVGRNIFDNTRLEMNVPPSSIVQVPVVTKKQYTLVDISEDMYVSMMDENSNVREDIKMNEEIYIFCYGLLHRPCYYICGVLFVCTA